MASNKMTVTVGMTKDIVEVCHQLMQERDNLQTHLDLSAQAIGALETERDEARKWARRMKRERDALKARCVELEARLDIGTGNLADIEPPKFVRGEVYVITDKEIQDRWDQILSFAGACPDFPDIDEGEEE